MDIAKDRRTQKMPLASYVCRDSNEYILRKKKGSRIENIPVIITETPTIRKALIQGTNNNYSKVIIESDSLIVFRLSIENRINQKIFVI